MISAHIQPDFDSWRQAARGFLAAGIPPTDILWTQAGEQFLPLAQTTFPSNANATSNDAPSRVPKEFLAAGRLVACHRDAARWALMYQLLWRLTNGEPRLLELVVDDDVRKFGMMEKAVSRDRHKMTAFVRFRRIESEAGERFVAWHQPDHLIVQLTTPFFVDRFKALNWTILTPDESVAWDGKNVEFGPGVPRSAAPSPDELESLWKIYYGSIFNPARIKLKAMRKEMPVRHWATLPETEIISDLLRDAPRRIAEMAKYSKAAEQASADSGPATLVGLSLPQLGEAAQSCRRCELHCRATQTVFGEGPANARLVFVGEQPGDEEDRSGHPFVGPAGQLLNDALREVGIDREQVYVTNAVKHFKWEPRGKRRLHKTPSSREVVACTPWVEAELSAIRPPLLVCLGATASRALFGRQFQLTSERGKPRPTPWAPWSMATWHPSALLRIPDAQRLEQARREFFADLKQAAGQLAAATDSGAN